MSRIFAITAASDRVPTGGDGRGEITFTVTNTSARPLRGRLRVRPLGSTKMDWLNVTGETERNFSPNATQSVVVKVATPAGAPAGKYQFRLDAVSVTNPDDDFTEGPTVDLEVKPTEAPKKPFPWWVVAAAAGAVVLVVGLAWLLWPGSVEVPDAAGLDVAEATKKFEDLGFKVEVTRRINSSVAVNYVFGQDPEAKSMVKAGSTVMLLVAAEKQNESTVIYEENFDDFSKDLSLVWSNAHTAMTPNEKTRFLGEFYNESPRLTLDKLPDHANVTISFDLYIIYSWDGFHSQHGPDVWGLSLEDGRPLFKTSFNNHAGARQDFACKQGEAGPSKCYTSGAAAAAAAVTNSLGYTSTYLKFNDSVYKIKYTFAHNKSFLILNFHDELKEQLPQYRNKSNEAWGLDNVRIELK